MQKKELCHNSHNWPFIYNNYNSNKSDLTQPQVKIYTVPYRQVSVFTFIQQLHNYNTVNKHRYLYTIWPTQSSTGSRNNDIKYDL